MTLRTQREASFGARSWMDVMEGSLGAAAGTGFSSVEAAGCPPLQGTTSAERFLSEFRWYHGFFIRPKQKQCLGRFFIAPKNQRRSYS